MCKVHAYAYKFNSEDHYIILMDMFLRITKKPLSSLKIISLFAVFILLHCTSGLL